MYYDYEDTMSDDRGLVKELKDVQVIQYDSYRGYFETVTVQVDALAWIKDVDLSTTDDLEDFEF